MGVLSWEKVLFRGYKTLCVTSEGLLALLLILPGLAVAHVMQNI